MLKVRIGAIHGLLPYPGCIVLFLKRLKLVIPLKIVPWSYGGRGCYSVPLISNPDNSNFCLKLLKLEKWFPLQGERAHSLYFWSFQKQNRYVGRGDTEQQPYQFTRYNILHRLQVHHLTLTFIIHNKLYPHDIYAVAILKSGVVVGHFLKKSHPSVLRYYN